MTRLKIVRPSPSFTIAVPAGVREEQEDRVTSFWVARQPLLLQVSSYVRFDGEQVDASTRLRERIEQHPEVAWTPSPERMHPDASIDEATAEHVDEQQVLWVHTYLVWPHLTVYATVSGPDDLVRQAGNWARQAVASVALAVH